MIPTEPGPTRSMEQFLWPVVVMLVLLLLPSRPLLHRPTPLRLMHRHPVHPRRLLRRRRPRTLNWWLRAALVVVPASSMLGKCAAIVVPTQASVPAVLLAMLPIPTIAVIPTSLHSSGSIPSPRRPGLAAANLRSTPEASASPCATAMLTAPSPVNAAMAFTRTTVDRRWPEVAECFVAISEALARTKPSQGSLRCLKIFYSRLRNKK